MAKRGRRQWMTPDTNKGPLKFYLCKKVEDENGVECEGFLDAVKNEAEMDAAWPEIRTKGTAFHELVHHELGSLSHEQREFIFGCKVGSDLMTKREEALCHHLELTLFDTLHNRNKFLKFPRLPKVK